MNHKEKIIRAWNEADELRGDFALSDNEIKEIIPSMRSRVIRICGLLQDEFTVEDYNDIYPEVQHEKI